MIKKNQLSYFKSNITMTNILANLKKVMCTYINIKLIEGWNWVGSEWYSEVLSVDLILI